MRAEFAYTDLDKDGFITLNELGQLAAQVRLSFPQRA